MKTTISTFQDKASYPEQAIVLIFDLEGFSKFFSQPDVHNYVPTFLNMVLEAVDLVFKGGQLYFSPVNPGEENSIKALPKPVHSKFLGDGALFIWYTKQFKEGEVLSMINRLWNLKTHFKMVLDKASEVIPIMDIPGSIRFGIAAGSVYKLTYEGSNREEFIGYSINLASRLQSYSRDIGFIASARINLKGEELEKNKYKKVVATDIKGFPREIVIVDKGDYESIPLSDRKNIFQEL